MSHIGKNPTLWKLEINTLNTLQDHQLNIKKEMSTLYFSFFKQILQNWILLSFTQDALIKLIQNVIQQKKKLKQFQAFFSNC